MSKNLSKILHAQVKDTLGIGESIPSAWIDTEYIDKVQVSAKASASGLTLRIESRTSAEQPILTTDTLYTEGPFLLFNIICRQRYMRFSWINTSGEAVSGASLELKATYGSSDKLSVFPVNVQPSDFSQAALVQSILRGRGPDGDYKNISTNQAGALYVDDFLFSVTRGEALGFSSGIKFGYNPDIDTGTDPEDVWGPGGLYTGHPLPSVTPDTINVYSSSASDTSAGTGLRTVRLYGLDANWEEQTEDITLNGTTAVTTSNTWRRLYRITGLTTGSGGFNVGVITTEYTSNSAIVFTKIPAGYNNTILGAFTVPAGKTCYIKKVRFNLVRASGAAGSAEVRLLTRDNNNNAPYVVKKVEAISTSSPLIVDIKGAIVVEEKSDILCRVQEVSDNNSQVSAAFEYILVDNME